MTYKSGTYMHFNGDLFVFEFIGHVCRVDANEYLIKALECHTLSVEELLNTSEYLGEL